MFDPVRTHFLSANQVSENFSTLAEEQHAQRYGRVVQPYAFSSKFTLRLGRLLIRIGEKLTGECPVVELSRENT